MRSVEQVVGEQTCASQLVVEHVMHGVALLHYLSCIEKIMLSMNSQ